MRRKEAERPEPEVERHQNHWLVHEIVRPKVGYVARAEEETAAVNENQHRQSCQRALLAGKLAGVHVHEQAVLVANDGEVLQLVEIQTLTAMFRGVKDYSPALMALGFPESEVPQRRLRVWDALEAVEEVAGSASVCHTPDTTLFGVHYRSVSVATVARHGHRQQSCAQQEPHSATDGPLLANR